MKWIPAARVLPEFDPRPTADLVEQFEREDAAKREAIDAEIDCDRLQRNYSLSPLTKEQAIRSMGTPHQPDDPGCVAPLPTIPKLLIIIPLVFASWAAAWAFLYVVCQFVSAK